MDYVPSAEKLISSVGAVPAVPDEDLPILSNPVLSNAVTLPETRAVSTPDYQPLPLIPDYEIIEELGQGGMGIVYKARHLPLNRLVAIKMLLPGCSLTREQLDRFLTEAQAVARFQHPNLVQIYEIGSHDGMPYLSLEYIDGGNLKEKLNGNPQPPAEAAVLVETLARTVEYAHQKAIVHRDLKPANVLLMANGTPKIADFGLAKQIDKDANNEKDLGIVGTPSYMAPEQASGSSGEVGPRGDIYALGVILYEMLIGRPPFQGVSRMQTVELVKFQEPVPPRRVVPQVPRDLELICLKCLQKDQTKRFRSAQELADELRRFQEGRPIKTRPTPLWEHAWKWMRRQPAVASLIVVSLIGIFSLVLYITHEKTRIDDLRDKVRDRHLEAQKAVGQGRLPDAQSNLEAAFEILRTEPSLSFLKSGLDALRNEVAHKEQEQQNAKNAEELWKRFTKLRDSALFHGMVFTGVDLPSSVAETKTACREALALYGITIPSEDPSKSIESRRGQRGKEIAVDGPTFTSYMTQQRQQQCREVCYELLLIWAEAVAQPESDEKEPTKDQYYEAIRLLNRAEQLGLAPTGAYHLRRGKYLEGLGLSSEASEEFALVSEARSEKALDYFLTGISNQKAGRLTEATKHFVDALRDQPDHFWARYFLGVCNLQLQQPAQARDNFTACMERRPDFLWLYLLRGFANGQLNEFRAAEEDYREAVARNPDLQATYGLLVNRGVLALRQARLSEVLLVPPIVYPLPPSPVFVYQGVADAYRAERLKAAARSLENAVELCPKQYPAYRYLALVFQHQKQLDNAGAAINQAIKHAPKHEPLVTAQLHGQRSRLYRERGNVTAALDDLTICLKALPSAEDYAERGRILFGQKQFQDAVAAFDAALKLRPTEAEVYRWKAQACLALRRDNEAAAAFDEYLKRGGPPSANVYRSRGQIRGQQQQFPGAIADYSQALALQPDSATFAARGWLFLGNEVVSLALQDFDQAIRLNSENAEAYSGRGLIRARQGRVELADADAEAALRHAQPRSPRLLWNIAHIHAQIVSHLDSQSGVRNRQDLIRRAAHLQRGMQMLQESLDRVPIADRVSFWNKFVSPDALLYPLRETQEFEDLERRYKGK